MSNYKLIQVSKDNTGKETQSIYDYIDSKEAQIALDNGFGVLMKQDTIISAFCLLIDNDTGERIDKLSFSDASAIQVEEGQEETVSTVIRPRVYTHNDYASDNIAAYDSERLAKGNYFTKKAASMNKEECNFAITICIDGEGEFLEFSKYEGNTD